MTAILKSERAQTLTMRGIGLLGLLIGVIAAFIAPIELHAYYLFSEGGKFAYEGFRFGSFMFAYITVQVVGYYAIAALGIVLGYGHLTLKSWVRPAMQTLIAAWLVIGLPLALAALLMLFLSKEPSPTLQIISAVLLPILYPILPLVVRRLYHSDWFAALLNQDDDAHWLERIPARTRLLATLLIGAIIALHFLLLLNGVFPWFGRVLNGSDGIMTVDVSILMLAALTWGLAKHIRIAWWGTLITLLVQGVSVSFTFAALTYRDLLLTMAFHESEMAWFVNMPFLDSHPIVVGLLPIAILLVVLLAAYRDFFPVSTP